MSVTNNKVESAHFANLGASISVKKLGTASVNKDEIYKVSKQDNKPKIISSKSLISNINKWRDNNLVIGFTNGCFDLVHAGHVDMLETASKACDRLIVAINSDQSIRKLKGKKRPVLDLKSREKLLRSLKVVDLVISFDEITPIKLIKKIKPNVLFKGADYKTEEIVGADFIQKNGGSVIRIALTKNQSTSNLISKLNNNN